MGRQTWFQFQGGFQCWTWNLLTAGLGFSLRWKMCQKTAMEVVDFAVDFCAGVFLVAKYKRKIRRKSPPENPPAENKKSAGARPPEIRTARPKNPPQNLPTNPSVKPPSTRRGFFRLKRIALGDVFRAWILGHSLAAFWAWSRLPCWHAPAIPQLLLVGCTRFAAHPSRHHFYHSPRKRYLPEKNIFELFFRLPFHGFDFFKLIFKNYLIPIAFVWVVWHYPVGTPVLVELFLLPLPDLNFSESIG